MYWYIQQSLRFSNNFMHKFMPRPTSDMSHAKWTHRQDLGSGIYSPAVPPPAVLPSMQESHHTCGLQPFHILFQTLLKPHMQCTEWW